MVSWDSGLNQHFPFGFTKENDLWHLTTLLRSWSASRSLRERFADHSLRFRTSAITSRCSSTPTRASTAYACNRGHTQLEDLARAPKGVYNNMIAAQTITVSHYTDFSNSLRSYRATGTNFHIFSLCGSTIFRFLAVAMMTPRISSDRESISPALSSLDMSTEYILTGSSESRPSFIVIHALWGACQVLQLGAASVTSICCVDACWC